ncbi:fibronectin type III domain-containing protein, partial [Spirosoma sp.]|uniref:beta strand repeat-containing protein n=1 Tax=Spirosoma sp. TaxID=1899569 RepID=UPI002607B04A
ANVVKTTGSYSNPTWLNALDPTRITQSSLHRFVSDSEKEAWNNKPDLAQVRSAIKDSLRTYTFVNAGVVTNGSSTTVTIPTGSGGASMPVDSVLSSTSPNAIANAAVTKAINQANASIATNATAISQANANIATNTAAISQANASIATNTTAISQANANIATNTTAIATNAASITALQTQVTAATATLSGPVDDARLSANVVKTTGTYSNPGWISAFDPTRITQTSLYRFVSDSEKETWNNKTDLSQVRLAIKDSVRAITFVNAVVTSNGNSLTVTIPNGGTNGSSVTVDNALSPTSTNPLTNAAINAAFNQVNNNMAANTAVIATNTTAINQINATISNLSNTVAANTATVTSSAASVTALQTQLAITMAQVASLSALVGQLQEQIAVNSGTYTISTPTLTASISSNTSILLSWGASTNATSYTLESATNSGFTENLTMLSVLSGTSYTATGLTAGITYYFRIKASGGSNTSPSGYGTVSATISTVQPTLSAPTNIVASVISSSAINVSWTTSPNATSYSVRYATNSSMTSATIITTSNNGIDLTGLTPGTSYFIDVSASAAGFTQSAASNIVTATTSAPVPTLATPTNIVASATSESAITVSWTGTLNATGYSVRYALTSDMTSATTVTTAINSVTLTGLTPVTTYFIDVSAMASGFTPSAASPTVAATTGAPTPTLTAPTNVAASPASPSTINVSWTASPNATGYSVRYATNSNMTSATTVSSSNNSITLTELAPATTYFINVSASASGYISSDASAVVTATTGQTPVTLAAPTNVVASPQSTSTIAVSWTASANATSYSVRYAINSSMTSATTVTTTTTSTILTGLKPSTFYFIDVSAMASGFTSSAPATTTAGTPDAAVTLAAPTNVVASPQSTSAITVSWTGSASATGYSVRYATNSSMTSATTVTTTATNTTLTGLKSSTSYFIDVSATAPGFTASVPTSATARTNDAPVTLPTPTNVVASAQSTSTIAVSWTGSTSATSYSVRYATSSSMTSATTITTTTTSTTLTDLASGTLYFVDISASAPGFVTSATSTTASARTIGNLAIPANVVATALGGSAIGVSWTASPNATSYSIRYALTSDMTSATTVTTAATSATITGLTTLTAYFVDVSASASGYITSATSPVSSATTTAAFVAERTFRLAFQGATSGVATTGWNQIKPTAAQITSPNSYTSGMLLTESGASSTIFVTLESPYTQATASSFTTTAGSIYPQTVMQSAWQVTSANLAGGRYSINGLTPGKYYQLYFLSATTIASNATVSYTINGVVKTINAGFNSGVGGGAEFAPNKALVTYFNVQPDANGRITVSNKYVSGTVSPFTTCVIRESSVPL